MARGIGRAAFRVFMFGLVLWTAGPQLGATSAFSAPCMIVTLTGTKGGPAAVNGLAGVGTLVRYGDDDNGCSAVKLQFDAGRSTSVRLSQIPLSVGEIDAIFFTHMHSDHTDGFADMMQLRWHYESARPKLDVVCAADAKSPLGHVCLLYTSPSPRD